MEEATILVIDDQQSYLNIMMLALKNKNYKILKALDGKTGCMLAERFLPDIIITDWEMPEMSGIETIIHLKSLESTKDIPIIMSSGAMTTSENLDSALKAGAVDYIRKPLDVIELLARINSALKLARSYKEIKKQRDEIEDQHYKIILQKDEIEKKNKKITDSIHYAKRIQSALLPHPEMIDLLLPEHFIFFKPRDIVSGDFYYIRLLKEQLLIAVADCTGHGIPGAFMSVLGITLLNEIIFFREIKEVNQILDELRNQIKLHLNQTGENSSSQDGMDIALCSINLENYEMQFAGAENPLIIIRNNEMSELVPDFMPVGIYPRENPFTKQVYQLQPNDLLFLFSDGYIDQTGGENKRRFMSSNFKNLLMEIHHKPLSDQEEFLNRKFVEWKGNYEQVDDILIVGVKILP